MNVLLNSIDHADCRSHILSTHLSLHEARQRGLQRTVQALFREKLLLKEHLIASLQLWTHAASTAAT